MLRLWILLPLSFLLSGCISQPVTQPPLPGIDTSSSVVRKLLEQHEQWRGAPYKLGGNSKQGIDCSGFTQVTFSSLFKQRLPRTTYHQANEGAPVSLQNLQAGDLVFFKTGGSKQRHVGIFVDNNTFLHASTSRGVTLSNLNNPYWAKHYWTARRVPLN